MNARSVHVAILAVVVVVSALAIVFLTSPISSASAVAPTTGIIPLTLSAGSSYSLSPAFWGANVRGYSSLGGLQKNEWDATPLSYVIWPGGRTGDAYDWIRNLIYSDDGNAFSPPSSVAQFTSWCRSVGCGAIMQLPGEIDSPSYAAREASYVVNTLHFQPAYWEIGNEPTLWTHFGDPWTSWNVHQRTNTTPMAYADLVRAYIQAVRAVDPGARFLGLPGVGTGAFDEQTWITATVRVNGPNLAGVAIHVYPAGGYGVTHGSDSQFFGSLTSKGALPERVPLDEAAIRAACATCKIGIFATELNSGNQGAGYNDQIGGFPEVTFLTAELIQGMKLNLANIDMYAFEASYGGAMFTGPSAPTRVDTLYSTLLSRLGSTVIPVTGPMPPLFYAIATGNPGSHAVDVLVANAGGSTVDLSLKNIGLCGTCSATLYSWTGASSKPGSQGFAGGVPASWSVPADSVGLFSIEGGGTSHGGSPPGNNTTGPAPFPEPTTGLSCPGTASMTCSSTTVAHAENQALRLTIRGEDWLGRE